MVYVVHGGSCIFLQESVHLYFDRCPNSMIFSLHRHCWLTLLHVVLESLVYETSFSNFAIHDCIIKMAYSY